MIKLQVSICYVNPVLPRLPPPLKLKVKEWFQVLWEDCKLLVAKLNVVHAKWYTMFECKNEKGAPVKIIGAIRQQTEVLAVMAKLKKLGVEQ